LWTSGKTVKTANASAGVNRFILRIDTATLANFYTTDTFIAVIIIKSKLKK